MKTPSERRLFARSLLQTLSRLAADFQEGLREGEQVSRTAEYFTSFENCYPLLNEAAPFLEEEARRLGLTTAELNREELARRLFGSEES